MDDSWLNRKITYKEYAEAINVPEKGLSIMDRMEYLPPSIFHSQIYLNKLDSENNIVGKEIRLNHLSSGERQFLYMMSTLVYHAFNLKPIATVRDRIQYNKLNLVMDEVEICFHPELQRQFINKMIGVLTRMKLNEHFDINILLTTHSPFVLSDIPTANLLCLEKGEPKKGDEVLKQTFCANVYDLLSNHFFMKQFIGDFAAKKLDEWVEEVKVFRDKAVGNNRAENSKLAKALFEKLSKVGDTFIRENLMQNLYPYLDNDRDVKLKRLKDLEREADILRKELDA